MTGLCSRIFAMALVWNTASALAQDADPSSPAQEAFEELEIDGDVESFEDEELSLREALGRFHPALVHLPIGWVWLLTLLEIGAFALKREDLATAGLFVAGCTFLSFFPAIATGLLGAGTAATDAASLTTLLLHRNLMFFAGLLTTAALVMRWRLSVMSRGLRYVYLVILIAATLVTSYGGHLGGELVYGPDYLPL